MIYHKKWIVRKNGGNTVYRFDGWFLFGIIPLYINRTTIKGCE